MKKHLAEILFVLILLLGALFMFLKPGMAEKKAVMRAEGVVKKVLTYWKNEDSATGRLLWEDRSKFPLVYYLDEFSITDSTVKKEGKVYFSTVKTELIFGEDSFMPSGTWVFKIKEERGVRSVLEFYHEKKI
jgi:hypothetical protein